MPEIRRAVLEEIIHLRHAVLRADTTIEHAYFVEDTLATTQHFGAFDDAGRCTGCATFLEVGHEAESAWQLRGMAVDGAERSRGVGRAMLDHAERTLVGASPVRLLWCHARKVAVPFYLRCGWDVVSDEYHIINIPHFKMTRRLSVTA